MSGRLLSKVEVTRICRGIDLLADRDRPVWKAVARIAESVAGRPFSRQALSDHKAIKSAYRKKLEAYHRVKDGRRSAASDSDENRSARLLSEENARLKSMVAEGDRRLNAMIAYLHLQGVDVRSLPSLLPELPREGR